MSRSSSHKCIVFVTKPMDILNVNSPLPFYSLYLPHELKSTEKRIFD